MDNVVEHDPSLSQGFFCLGETRFIVCAFGLFDVFMLALDYAKQLFPLYRISFVL